MLERKKKEKERGREGKKKTERFGRSINGLWLNTRKLSCPTFAPAEATYKEKRCFACFRIYSLTIHGDDFTLQIAVVSIKHTCHRTLRSVTKHFITEYCWISFSS
jgi:hypothetical protein